MINKYMNRLKRFLERCNDIHGDKYDYSKVDYVNMHTPINIICPEHGEFTQIPNNHAVGKRCPQCALLSFTKKRKWDTDKFIIESRKVHGDKYDYSKVDYTGQDVKVVIGCPIHGEFEQIPLNHLRYDCNRCGNIKISDNTTYTKDKFITRAKGVHGDKYDYSKVDYTGMFNEVLIKCPDHGEFKQTPSNHTHVKKYGCMKCTAGNSKAEKDVLDFIKLHYKDHIIENDRTIIKPLELDIVLPDLKIAIEYCGLYWHSDKFKPKNYHLNKLTECELAGYRLITIFEDEWIHKQDIVKSKLLNIIGINNLRKVGARTCQIKTISKSDKSIFLNNYHIQGNHPSSLSYGLYDTGGELVSMLTMKRKPNGVFELSRFASAYNVMGGFSKLLKHFKSNNEWDMIYTFADRRWSDINNNVYGINGFELAHTSQPNYFYIKKCIRLSRVSFQKHKLSGILAHFNIELTEHVNMHNNGYNWIYDCGNIKYTLKNLHKP